LFEIHSELCNRFRELEIVPCVADITDVPRVTQVFREHRPMIVFHAAAYKHVPMMEWNPAEAVKNNILGTQVIAEMGNKVGVDEYQIFCTNKMLMPTSGMVATKRAAELYIQALSVNSATHFATVRFGNVLGSAGSVIPIFRRQIRNGGPVTVTHPDMTRYFMTIPEAVQLVVQAAALSRGGETFILDMGQPVRIIDLARDLIRLSGLEPDKDIELRFTGIRPGEKLFEELSTMREGIERTTHPKIFTGTYDSPHLPGLRAQFDMMGPLCKTANAVAIRQALAQLIPEYGDDDGDSEPPARPSQSRRESKRMESM
jgi:FlaA1/EpsC-like NDP-sugar epimerase